MGWLIAAIVIAAFGGMIGGGFAALGIVEVVTGRILINPRHLPWSRREAQIIGLCRVVQGVVVAGEGAALAFMTGTDMGPASRFMLPVFWMLTLVLGVALSIPTALQVRMWRHTGLPRF
jgi:hypothetical protein